MSSAAISATGADDDSDAMADESLHALVEAVPLEALDPLLLLDEVAGAQHAPAAGTKRPRTCGEHLFPLHVVHAHAPSVPGASFRIVRIPSGDHPQPQEGS